MRTVDLRVAATLMVALVLGLMPIGATSSARSSEAGSSDLSAASDPGSGDPDSGGSDALTLSTETRTAIVPDGPVERLAGPDRIATAVAVSRRAFPDGADEVVLATAGAFPDALTAAPLAYRGRGPLLLVGDRLDPAVAEEIERLGATTVRVPGGIAAVPYVVQVELQETGLEVDRLAGRSRFDTAALIARELGLGPSREVAVATAGTFADALSFASLSAAGQIPVLLVTPEQLTSDTRAALRSLDPARTIILGGEKAVSEELAAALPDPTRYAGEDRFGTATAIADLLLERGGTASIAYVATGRDFPDALAAGPVAALGPGPLILVDGLDAQAADPAWSWLDRHDPQVGAVVIFGGSEAVIPEVADRLRVYADGSGDGS